LAFTWTVATPALYVQRKVPWASVPGGHERAALQRCGQRAWSRSVAVEPPPSGGAHLHHGM